MPCAVELHFDEASTAAIVALTNQIHATCGGLDLVRSGGAPHLSLALPTVSESMPLLSLLAAFATQTPAFPLAFAAVGTFPGPQGVVYLAPVVTAELLTIHRTFHTQLAAIGITSNPLYLPGQWVPHCTVGFALPAAGLGQALLLCRETPWPRTVMVTALRLIAFDPHTMQPGPAASTTDHRVAVLFHSPLAP